MTKNEIRQRIREQKKRFQNVSSASAQIVRRIQTLAEYQSARTVGVYMPLPDEVDLRPLFQDAGKQLYIPVFEPVSGQYRMAQLTPELTPGRYSIPEPAHPVFAAADEIDLILVPGVAFDRSGHRIGRGGGFYDRLLTYYQTLPIGVAFDFQWMDAIPYENHDVSMRKGISEIRIIEMSTNH
ncbi:MAG: 5-formyltetrahydrofolate cyclo-ligase [Kiritimatiellaceae bacterium]|nr:5-formyltetrahydrofolate cyclo-ligase [Kiritimatiellaceae bacterium]